MDLLEALAWGGYLALMLVFGWFWSGSVLRARKAERLADHLGVQLDDANAAVAELDAINSRLHTVAAAAVTRYHDAVTDLRDARLDAEWARLWTTVVEAERDLYENAWRRTMLHQARQELTSARAEEPVRKSNVIEVEVGRWRE